MDEEWIEAEEGGKVDWVGVDRYETSFKPLRLSTWGKLPRLVSRVQIAKLANNVYTHVFAQTELINWKIAREGWSPNYIPVLFPALKALDGARYISNSYLTTDQGDYKRQNLKPYLRCKIADCFQI